MSQDIDARDDDGPISPDGGGLVKTHKWRCPRCHAWVVEPLHRVCLRCRFDAHRAADAHCTCPDCLAWHEGTHELQRGTR
jgi:hypothetical protein